MSPLDRHDPVVQFRLRDPFSAMNRFITSPATLRRFAAPAIAVTLALLAAAAHATAVFSGYVAPTGGYYRVGATIDIGVQYSELVVVTGTPRLRLTTGGGPTLYATYASGSESETLTFRYTVPAGANAPFLTVAALELNGGSIVNLDGEPAGAPATPQRFDATIDTAAPAVVSLRRFHPLERHTGSGTVIYRVAFSEWVANTAPAAFTLRTSGTATGAIAWVRGDRADWYVAVTNISGQGSLALEVRPNIVCDYAGNTIAGFVTNEPYACVNATAPYAWGAGTYGQLGNNANLASATPVPLYAAASSPLAGQTVGHLAAGFEHSVALARNGRLFAWGHGQAGQIGNGYNQSYNYPEYVKIDGGLASQQVLATAAGGDFNLALAATGLVFAWGDNADGQLGRGNTTGVNEPVYVADTGTPMQGKTIVAVAAGYRHALALDSSGQVYAWGDNSQGQLGNNSTTDSTVPVAVSTSGALAGKRVVALAAGFWFSAALTADGQVVTWGMNHVGQLGLGTTENSLVPVAVTGGAQAGRTALEIAAGGSHLLVRNSDGTVVAWGANYYGQLGNNSSGSVSLLPVAVDSAPFSGAAIARLAAGDSHSLALATDGRLFSWGYNHVGQLGLGTTSTAPTSSPALVPTVAPDSTYAATGLDQGGTGNHSLAFLATRTFASMLNGPSAATYGTGAQLDFHLSYPGSVTVAGTPYLVIGLGNRLARADLVANNGYGGLTFRYTIEPGDYDDNGLSIQAYVGAERVTDSRGLGVNTALPSNTNISGLLIDAVAPQPLEITRAQPYAFTEAAAETSASALIYRITFDKPVTGVDPTDFTLATTGTAAGTVANVLGTGDSRFVVVTGVTGSGALRLDVKPAGTEITDTIGNPLAAGLATGPCYYHMGGTAVVAWGGNDFGQCGSANFGGTLSTPSLINSGALAGRTVAALATGGSHSLALCSNGTLVAWGDNSSGQLGCGNLPAQHDVPTAVLQTNGLSGRTVIAIAAGNSHSLALTSDGQVFGWGSNASGQLGRSDTSLNLNAPIHLSQLGALADKQVVAIAAGAHHSLALTADGLLYAWGADNMGQLGNGFYGSSTTPYPVDQSGALAGKRLLALAAGNTHTLVLDAAGQAYAWGSNTYGELGNDGYSIEESPVPVDLSTAASGRSTTVVALTAGAGFSLALAQDGALYAWGNNSRQQLGLDSTTSTYRTPVAVAQDNLGSDTIVALAAGAAHTLARTDSGALYGWGSNYNSQLGSAFSFLVARPSRIESGALTGASIAVIPASCIAYHSLVLSNTSGAPLALIEQWRLDNFNTPFATSSAADDADPDVDGRTNLVEYATGTSPINANSGPVATLAVAGTGANRQLTLTFNRIADPSITYTVEASTSLVAASWMTIVPPAEPLTGPVTVTDPTFMSSHSRRFLRLRLVRTP